MFTVFRAVLDCSCRRRTSLTFLPRLSAFLPAALSLPLVRGFSENELVLDCAFGFLPAVSSVALPVNANVSLLVRVSATAVLVTLPSLTVTGAAPNAGPGVAGIVVP